jgi:hypothetical protein
MANIIVPAVEYRNILQEIYELGSLTSFLDSQTKDLDKSPAGEVKLQRIKTTGFGDYDRDVGFKTGRAEIKWETYKLLLDRGIEFRLDRLDSIETMNTGIGTLSRVFVNTKMIPEIDATRFSRFVNGAGTKLPEAITAANILDRIDQASFALSDNKVPETGRVLFVNQELSPVLNAALPRQWSNEDGINTVTRVYNGMLVRYVPRSRFYDLIELNSDSMEDGYFPATGAKQINFIMLDPNAIWQAVKVNIPKYLSADDPANPIDSHKFMFRVHHDAGVMETYTKGVYASVKAA